MKPGAVTPPSARALVVIGVGLTVLGLVSTRIGFASFQLRLAVLTLLTGWLVAGLGLGTWQRASNSRVGPLLVATATAWFVPGLAWVAWPPVAALAHLAALLWVPLIGSALLTYPSGRIDSRRAAAGIVLTTLVALVPSARQELFTAMVLATALVATWFIGRRQRLPGHGVVTAAGLGLCLVLATWRTIPSQIGLARSFDPSPLLQGALVACVIVLAACVVRLSDRTWRVADLVVDLGDGQSSGLARELGRLLGDPTLRIGLWLPQQNRYIDTDGQPFEPPASALTAVTAVDLDGRPVALLVHDPRLPLGPDIVSGIATAAALASANAALQAELRAQVQALHASRDRVMTAGEQERATLERALRLGLGSRLDSLEGVLRTPPLGGPTVQPILDEVADARHDLRTLAEGLGLWLPDGVTLAQAIDILIARCPTPVESVVRATLDPDDEARACLLFVIGEALTNVSRHAAATGVVLRVDSDDQGIRLSVTDDGRGGADPSAGSGLAGLRDRVEALGGRLRVTSEPGRGTRLDAELPASVKAATTVSRRAA